MITVQNIIDTFDRMEKDPEWIDYCTDNKIPTTLYDRSQITKPSAEVTIDIETEYEGYSGMIEFYAPQDDFWENAFWCSINVYRLELFLSHFGEVMREEGRQENAYRQQTHIYSKSPQEGV